MLQLLRVIWVGAILINLSAVIWFILGTTANFQRGIDLVSTVILVYFGIPSILFIILSFVLLFKGGFPSSVWSTVIVSIMILCMLSLSPTLFKSVNTSGWLTENIVTDTLQTTADGQYEYQLELVNLFQKNSSSRLYLKNISTGEETRISLQLPTRDIHMLPNEKMNFRLFLEVTSEQDMYILHTTPQLPTPLEKYKVDVKKKVAVKIG